MKKNGVQDLLGMAFKLATSKSVRETGQVFVEAAKGSEPTLMAMELTLEEFKKLLDSGKGAADIIIEWLSSLTLPPDTAVSRDALVEAVRAHRRTTNASLSGVKVLAKMYL